MYNSYIQLLAEQSCTVHTTDILPVAAGIEAIECITVARSLLQIEVIGCIMFTYNHLESPKLPGA